MATGIENILQWWKRYVKPTEAQVAETFRSFRHKNDAIPVTEVDGINNLLIQKADRQTFEVHVANTNAHVTTQEKQDWSAKLDEEDVVVGGRNLIIIKDIVTNKILNNEGDLVYTPYTYNSIDYKNIEPDTDYILSVDRFEETSSTKQGFIKMSFFDANNSHISQLYFTGYTWEEKKIKTPVNTAKYRISGINLGKGKIQLEKGTFKTQWNLAPEDTASVSWLNTNGELPISEAEDITRTGKIGIGVTNPVRDVDTGTIRVRELPTVTSSKEVVVVEENGDFNKIKKLDLVRDAFNEELEMSNTEHLMFTSFFVGKVRKTGTSQNEVSFQPNECVDLINRTALQARNNGAGSFTIKIYNADGSLSRTVTKNLNQYTTDVINPSTFVLYSATGHPISTDWKTAEIILPNVAPINFKEYVLLMKNFIIKQSQSNPLP